jgi:hypothetical protein
LFFPLGFLVFLDGLRWLVRRRSGALRLSGGSRGLVQHQILGRNLSIGSRLRAEVDAEQILRQSFPGIFFTAGSGAQGIGVHGALIAIIKRIRGRSLRRKAAKTTAKGKH